MTVMENFCDRLGTVLEFSRYPEIFLATRLNHVSEDSFQKSLGGHDVKTTRLVHEAPGVLLGDP